jgi:hypothetical protein
VYLIVPRHGAPSQETLLLEDTDRSVEYGRYQAFRLGAAGTYEQLTGSGEWVPVPDTAFDRDVVARHGQRRLTGDLYEEYQFDGVTWSTSRPTPAEPWALTREDPHAMFLGRLSCLSLPELDGLAAFGADLRPVGAGKEVFLRTLPTAWYRGERRRVAWAFARCYVGARLVFAARHGGPYPVTRRPVPLFEAHAAIAWPGFAELSELLADEVEAGFTPALTEKLRPACELAAGFSAPFSFVTLLADLLELVEGDPATVAERWRQQAGCAKP